MAAFLNCVPFGADITDLLGCLFGYMDIVAAMTSVAGHRVTISNGHTGAPAYTNYPS